MCGVIARGCECRLRGWNGKIALLNTLYITVMGFRNLIFLEAGDRMSLVEYEGDKSEASKD
jgi:hypothetical protein